MRNKILSVVLVMGAFVMLRFGLGGSAQAAIGKASFCTTSNSQAAFLVKAISGYTGQSYEFYVPIGKCGGGGNVVQPSSTPFAFHVPNGWCAEFLKAPDGTHYTARGSDGGSGGQWVQFRYTETGQWWGRHYRCN